MAESRVCPRDLQGNSVWGGGEARENPNESNIPLLWKKTQTNGLWGGHKGFPVLGYEVGLGSEVREGSLGCSCCSLMLNPRV